MTQEQINQFGLNAARDQRIAADDRALQLAVDLQIARARIAELEAAQMQPTKLIQMPVGRVAEAAQYPDPRGAQGRDIVQGINHG